MANPDKIRLIRPSDTSSSLAELDRFMFKQNLKIQIMSSIKILSARSQKNINLWN